MTKTTKITKAMVLNALKAHLIAGDIGSVVVDDVEVTAEDVSAFIENSLEQLAKKAESSKKAAAKKAKDSDELSSELFDLIGAEPVTLDDLAKNFSEEEGVTRSKISSRLAKFVATGELVKSVIKVGDLKRTAYARPDAE